MNELSKHIDKINELCKSNNVKTLFAFGSVLTNEFNNQSDIDLLVDIAENDPLIYSENYFNLKFQLEEIFKRHIDLLEQKAVKNAFLQQAINKTKVLLYAS